MRWVVLILLGMFLISFASAVVPDDCDGSMVAYWKMDGDLTDSFGNHNGIKDGIITYTLPLVVDEAAAFDGSSSVGVSDWDPDPFESSFTIEMWIKAEYVDVPVFLFKKGQYLLEINSSSNLVFNAGTTSVSYPDEIIPVTPYHIAVSWDHSELKLYVNGLEEDKISMTGSSDSTGSLTIGENFIGLIDEFAIYDKSLSSSDIISHYSLSNGGSDYCEGASSAETFFTIPGCKYVNENGDEFRVLRGSCSEDGRFYCGEDGDEYNTFTSGLGCSKENVSYTSDSNNDNICCPGGYYCSGEDGNFMCEEQIAVCDDFSDYDDCLENNCFWLGDEDEGVCVPTIEESCNYYKNQEDCEEDVWRLGQRGIGTEMCGTSFECVGKIFIVPEDNCSCKWFPSAPDGKQCRVNLVARQSIFGSDGVDIFDCSNSYVLGDCIDGTQVVNWYSNSSVIDGFSDYDGEVPEECLNVLNCNDGEGTRFCGEDVIKLPGFSLFALFSSLFIIGLYYVKREERFK